MLRLVVLVFEECLALSRGVLLFAVGCLLLGECYNWSYWFLRNVSNLVGCVTLCCRMPVAVRPLRWVELVFEECLKLSGGVSFFVVGCLLLRDRYDWSYWFWRNVSNLVGVWFALYLHVVFKTLFVVSRALFGVLCLGVSVSTFGFCEKRADTVLRLVILVVAVIAGHGCE